MEDIDVENDILSCVQNKPMMMMMMIRMMT